MPLAEAVAAFIESKRLRVGERQLADLRDRLKRLADDATAESAWEGVSVSKPGETVLDRIHHPRP